jgi:hypothetical protein
MKLRLEIVINKHDRIKMIPGMCFVGVHLAGNERFTDPIGEAASRTWSHSNTNGNTAAV